MARLRAYLFIDPLIVLATIFFGILSLIRSLFDESGDGLIRVARRWAKVLLAVGGVKVEVEGLEHIDPTGSYVFVSNHASYMDTPVVLANIPVQFRFLAKRGLFQIPLLGTHLSQAGHIPVPREDPRASVKTMQLAAETIQRRHISMLVFPEGGRSADGVMREFKEGAAYIAIRAGVPLVPLAIIGTHAVLPMHSGVVRPGRVKLCVLPPISTKGLTLKDRTQMTEHLHELIAAQGLASAGQSA
jgi:1-acyl-sn-glycerol-3-phosphate acyltransferase